MQGFVRARTGSPSNAQPQGKPDRQANAASARILVRNGHPNLQSQAPSEIPARGHTNAKNSSVALQQPPQHRHPGLGPGQKRDPYDTDAESIDTTVNQSVVHVEDSQQKEQRYQQQGQVSEYGESSEMDVEDEEDEYEGDEQGDQCELTQEEEHYIRQNGLQHLPHAEKISFLHQSGRRGFPTVDGDSYPDTTNGELSEWSGGYEAASHFHDGGDPVIPSPQRQNVNNQAVRTTTSQTLQEQQRQIVPVINQNMQKPSQMFQHGAHLREQSRATAPVLQYGGQNIQQSAAAPPISQHQTYNWSRPHPAAHPPMHSIPHPDTYTQPDKSQQNLVRQASGPRTQIPPNQNIVSIEPPAPTRRPPPLPAIQEPIIQSQPIEKTLTEEHEAVSLGDYDQKTLLKKKYEELRTESFDVVPNAAPPVLASEDLHKPLVERLPLVQKNLDVDQQSNFFRSLPTTEWEDAGDWFLDQFQNIIQRTKQARQKKRKLAQEFEAEVEKRYEHVSKKQHQVQEAMDKMKEQGEGLVLRSPRPSKSPMPSRR